MTARVLVVEDTPTQAELARALLVSMGHEVRLAASAAEAMRQAEAWPPDAVLLDVELPDSNGFALMRDLRDTGVTGAIIVVTANGSVNAAVEAMRGGAEDFIVKPYARARLEVTLANALEKRALVAELHAVRAGLARERFHGFIGASAPMQAAYRTIESVARSRASVFITGESGTGKELAARAVHQASARSRGPFLALNCGAIPRDLLESEVFGHVRGAFTGAVSDRAGAAKLADGGTLFLDEIAEMPVEMQVKLLRFVQTGTFQPVGGARGEKVDVRFICATHREPRREVEAGRFREDLYYRLYVVPLELPPLRARGDDVMLLALSFLAEFSHEERKGFRGFSRAAEDLLTGYAWPGNVRQLQNVIRNIVVLHDGSVVGPEMIPPLSEQLSAHHLIERSPRPDRRAAIPSAIDDEPILPLAVAERRLVDAALRRTEGDVAQAAALLKVSPSTIYRKLHAWKSAQSHSPG